MDYRRGAELDCLFDPIAAEAQLSGHVCQIDRYLWIWIVGFTAIYSSGVGVDITACGLAQSAVYKRRGRAAARLRCVPGLLVYAKGTGAGPNRTRTVFWTDLHGIDCLVAVS